MRVRLTLLVLMTVPLMAGKSPPPPPPAIPACAGDAQSSSNFGCSNEANLRAMVDDQRDLVLGRATGGPDAIVEAAAINRLRTDKVKKLRSNATTDRGVPGE